MKRRDFLNSSLLTAAISVPGIRTAYAVIGAGPVADLAAVTGDGREITLRGTDVRDLAARMRGQLLLAADDGYDKARMIMNPSFDKRPALIAQPSGAADVQAVVNFARANNLLVAVKCGGHSASGQSTCDRGLQIDLSKFRGVRVDPRARRAWVEGGTLLGEVDHETSAHGLVAPLGTVSHTGVGGLTTGGGFGRLTRRFGMSIDNLESVDVVTADGQLRHASAGENPDLFWGVRGGGGNFGIVTSFEFRLQPMQREVVAGSLNFPIARARDVLGMYAQYAATAPDELYLDPVLVLPARGGPGLVSLDVCYSGPQDKAEAALAPIRKLGKPDQDTLKAQAYVDVQRSNDTGDSRAIASYLKGGFISKMPEQLVSSIIDGLPAAPDRTAVLFFQHCGGAASRQPENATAFAQRDSVANMMAIAAWRQGAVDPAEHMQATRKYWSTLEPFTRGFYVNDLAREASASEINANYRGNYPRLVKIKNTYDPTNLFRLNANIKPG
ncbi:MAG TPA: FAD-binding oxidoreductase [Steroidobacteraceae bacterium]|nr:FAD-binding oxidoreductase [Steroidobacteraceae bacterium]